MCARLKIKYLSRQELEALSDNISFTALARDNDIEYPTKLIKTYSLNPDSGSYEWSIHINRCNAKVEAVFHYTDSEVILYRCQSAIK